MSGSSWTATYDDEQRLTTWDVSTGDDESWTYTAADDWSAHTRGTVNETRTHGNTHELLNITGNNGTQSLSYDSQGRLTSDGSAQYTWDDDHRLESATIPNGSATGIEGTHTYEYDAMGRRVSKTVDDITNNTTTKTIFINQLVTLPPLGTKGGRVIAEYQSINAGAFTLTRSQTFTNDVDELIAVIHQDVAGDPVYYTHHDRRYTVVGSTPETQSTDAAFAHYNVHGHLTQQSTTNPALPTVPETTTLAYTGRDYDQETHLWYFRARAFSAISGRFLSRDPSIYLDGTGLYSSYFSPHAVDPSGRVLVRCWYQSARNSRTTTVVKDCKGLIDSCCPRGKGSGSGIMTRKKWEFVGQTGPDDDGPNCKDDCDQLYSDCHDSVSEQYKSCRNRGFGLCLALCIRRLPYKGGWTQAHAACMAACVPVYNAVCDKQRSYAGGCCGRKKSSMPEKWRLALVASLLACNSELTYQALVADARLFGLRLSHTMLHLAKGSRQWTTSTCC